MTEIKNTFLPTKSGVILSQEQRKAIIIKDRESSREERKAKKIPHLCRAAGSRT